MKILFDSEMKRVTVFDVHGYCDRVEQLLHPTELDTITFHNLAYLFDRQQGTLSLAITSTPSAEDDCVGLILLVISTLAL